MKSDESKSNTREDIYNIQMYVCGQASLTMIMKGCSFIYI